MDYPKSVPGVGLAGGKFVDENTAMGQQGSLIPSSWGNAVTEEICNVIKDAGDVPDEGDLSQMQKAIRKIVALVWPKASDAELALGVVDDKVVTPKRLSKVFSIGQAMQDVMPQRAIGVIYTNTTNRPIWVTCRGLSVGGGRSTLLLSANGAEFAHALETVADQGMAVSAMVMPGSSYVLNALNVTVNKWLEYR